MGNNFGENAGYYKLDLIKTFKTTLCDREIRKSTCKQYTKISEDGGPIICFHKTDNGGGCTFLDPSDLLMMDITSDSIHYNPETGYFSFTDKVYNCPLYFEKLDECPSGDIRIGREI